MIRIMLCEILILLLIVTLCPNVDCSSESNKIAGIISCGGVVRDTSVLLYDSPRLCCLDKLNWVPEDACVGKSINIESDWLQDMIEDLSD